MNPSTSLARNNSEIKIFLTFILLTAERHQQRGIRDHHGESAAEICSLQKDVIVIVESKGIDVKTTTIRIRSGKKLKTESFNGNLFFLHFSSRLQDEEWQLQLIKAFSEAGFAIKKDLGRLSKGYRKIRTGMDA